MSTSNTSSNLVTTVIAALIGGALVLGALALGGVFDDPGIEIGKNGIDIDLPK